MKPRPPTLRQNRRYVLFRVAPALLVPDGKSLYLAIAEAVSALYGDAGAAVIDQAVVAIDRGHAIVRCRRGEEERLIGAVATVSAVNGTACALHPRAVSGTILSLRDRLVALPESVALDETADGEVVRQRRRIGAARVDVIEHDYKGERVVYFETIHPEER
ncbi:MAG: Rpp14/Pop5 family protein [Methanospirillum sp.]